MAPGHPPGCNRPHRACGPSAPVPFRAVPSHATHGCAILCPVILLCAMPCSPWPRRAVPRSVVPCHTVPLMPRRAKAVPCSAVSDCAMPCHTVPHHTFAVLCCARLRFAVPYHAAAPRGARALLTRLGGRCGAEQVATSRSHWRVSSSQHPSGNPGDRQQCWRSTMLTRAPRAARCHVPAVRLVMVAASVSTSSRSCTGSHVTTGRRGHVPGPPCPPGLTVRLRCGVPSTARRLSAAQHRGGSTSV